MAIWQIRFLGPPTATCDGQQARLRSRETWGVLASLLIPSLLTPRTRPALARETLAERFWADSATVEPKTHLRQCLSSLRAAFGDGCLRSDRHEVAVSPDWYETDLKRIFTAYRHAQEADSLEERLRCLLEAEQEIGGEFLEGWSPETEEAQVWVVLTRADLRSRLLPMLQLLAQTLETIGNLQAAFDVVRRILQFQPGHREARAQAWRLAVATGQQDVMHALERIRSFREAVDRLPDSSSQALTIEDGRLFQSLFTAELQTLPSGLLKPFLRLAVFPGPFSAVMAQTVCRTAASALQLLAETPFLQRIGERFLLNAVVRECAWRLLGVSTRQRLRRRLALFCIDLIEPNIHRFPSLFSDETEAAPFMYIAVDWLLKQRPEQRYLIFLSRLRELNLIELAQLGVPYMQQVRSDPAYSAEMRIDSGMCAAVILMDANRHAEAVKELEATLALAEGLAYPASYIPLYTTLMITCHYAGDSERAVAYGMRSLAMHRARKLQAAEAGDLRFLGEIYTHIGDFEQALHYCEEALRLRRELDIPLATLADTLYWKAKCLFQLGRLPETEESVLEALALWQQAGDQTGIGFCLRLLGRIRCLERRFAEAQAHLDHALLLHLQDSHPGNRIAAMEALADIFQAQERRPEADKLYRECLDYYVSTAQPSSQDRLLRKLQNTPDVP